MEKETELTVESKMENLTKIGEFLTETMKNYDIQNVKDIYAVQLSVDEACTNIIQHAYPDKNDGLISIQCLLSSGGNKFTINIIDWGRPFDLTTVPKPDIECGLNERKIGGLGIFFMREFMDEVSYVRSENRNLLIIVKYIKK